MLDALDGPTQLLFVAIGRGLSSVHECRRLQDSIPSIQGEQEHPLEGECSSQAARKSSLSLVERRLLLEGLKPSHAEMGTGIQPQGSDAETSTRE